jgi:3-oxoadipate enol-lactonase
MPLLFVHGHPFDATMWRNQLARFDGALAPDLRGFGRSTGRVGAWTDFADDLAVLLSGPTVVVGLSMGGQIVLDLQQRYPHLVAGMLLADTSAGPDPDPDGRRAAGARLLAEGMDPYAVEVLHRMVSPDAQAEVAEHVLAMMRDTDPAAAAAAHIARADRPDHRPRLGSITVPTTVVVGSMDDFTPIPVAREMSDAIPGAELVVIPHVAHMPPLEAPDEFDAALSSLISRADPGR